MRRFVRKLLKKRSQEKPIGWTRVGVEEMKKLDSHIFKEMYQICKIRERQESQITAGVLGLSN